MPLMPSRARAPFAASPASRQALLDAAKSALANGDPARARALLAAPLRQSPGDPAMLAFSGIASRALGDALGATELLERAVDLAPDLAPARLALAEALLDVHRAPRALDMLGALPARLARTPAALSARAAALAELGDEPGAVTALGKLVAADPASAPARLRLGHALRAVGRTDEALAQYRTILALDPGNGAAWWSIASVASAAFSDADVAAMEAALAGADLGSDDRARILFALARAQEIRRDDARSFALYAEANALRHCQSQADRDRVDAGLAASASLFTADFFAARPGHGCQSDEPIFIVGMQRSGSTLLEQMLSSHNQVEGTSELPHINQQVRECRAQARLAGRSVEQWIAGLDAAQARALGEDYLARAAPHRHSAKPRFLDKSPNNWAHIGFIRLILPRARIIDVRRDPMACGWSNFRQLYATGLEHCYSLADWAHHYRAYLAFVDALPDRPLQVCFEALVADPARELRRVCDYLDIDFDPVMLDFHANPRTVRTISAEQVRRPLDRSAVDEWRRFEQWLGPLRDALHPAPTKEDRDR